MGKEQNGLPHSISLNENVEIIQYRNIFIDNDSELEIAKASMGWY